MLKIRKTPKQVILYDNENFELYHTHLSDIHMARIIRSNVENKRIPKTLNLRMLYSHYRVAKDENYKEAIKRKIDYVNNLKNENGL